VYWQVGDLGMGLEDLLDSLYSATQSQLATDLRLSLALVPSYQIHQQTCNLTQNLGAWTDSHLSVQDLGEIASYDVQPFQAHLLNYQLSTINYQLSTLNYQLSTINYQLSTINYQLSTLNYQLSTINSQLSTLNSQITSNVIDKAAKPRVSIPDTAALVPETPRSLPKSDSKSATTAVGSDKATGPRSC
jgi:hypothetical protein